MKLTFLFLLFTSGIVAQCTLNTSDLGIQLEESFSKNDETAFVEIFESWSKFRKGRNLESSQLSKYEVEAYRLFELFYKPKSLNDIGGSEWGDTLYSNIKYAVIQDTLALALTGTLNQDSIIQRNINQYDLQKKSLKKLKKDGRFTPMAYELFGEINQDSIECLNAVTEFSPILNTTEFKTLYYDEDYIKVLRDFITNKFYKQTHRKRLGKKRARLKTYEKIEFIGKYIQVHQKHWVNDWNFVTHPKVYRILFDKKLETAILYYRIIYEGGEARFENRMGNGY